MTLDLRRKALPPAAPSGKKSPNQFAFKPGDPPLAPGSVFLSQSTREGLALVGYESGDPLPANLSEKLAALSAAYNADLAVAVPDMDPNTPPTVPKKNYNIDELPEHYRQELREFIAGAKDDFKALQTLEQRQQTIARKTRGLAPSVAQVVQQTLEAEVAEQFDNSEPELTIIDDANDPTPAQRVAAATPAPAAQPDETGAAEHLLECPRCHLDLTAPYEIEVTDADRIQYQAVLLSPSPKTRFRKQVTLLDGKMVLTFRTLTTREAKLVNRQMGIHASRGEIESEALYWMQWMEYRLCAALESIADNKGSLLHVLPELADVQYDPPGKDEPAETVLVPLLEHVQDTVLGQDTLQRVVGQHHRRFQYLVEALEAETSDPNFCKGIEPPA